MKQVKFENYNRLILDLRYEVRSIVTGDQNAHPVSLGEW